MNADHARLQFLGANRLSCEYANDQCNNRKGSMHDDAPGDVEKWQKRGLYEIPTSKVKFVRCYQLLTA
jgi:hypothetical protein